ncbi:serine/threonine protein kinase [Aquincola tertiaricarbonis]|uniref:non-specific serine/threonine protein kinase n=1 Tax=Aquincola tertiaricarbonis TaxID=391953 RepID=A0ABY4SD18_AQUTE|nr:serine/threonine-protein kinase [Aquincola tertiaricarbonis]URI10374.1 serine/threonine protein kinase [Aquincola tertiaricarbonis]
MGDSTKRPIGPAQGSERLLQRDSEFDGYRIHRLLGRGAIGAVYLASNRRGKLLALKTIDLVRQFERDELPLARERLALEALTTSRLRHPHIVRVYGCGERRGLAYLAMQALPGCTMERYTQRRHLLPEPLALQLAASVADGLAHAHAQGVVHRDIKPANVMVELPTRRVKITDFGLARLTDGTRTRTGLVLGTPAFMAPELLAGAPPHPGSDLYALGVLLFQLLTARLPYEGESMGTLLRAIAGGPPQSLRLLRPDLPAELAELTERLLDRTPRARPADGLPIARQLREMAARWQGHGVSKDAATVAPWPR